VEPAQLALEGLEPSEVTKISTQSPTRSALTGPEPQQCLYCYSEMVRILNENVWRCVNTMCALYMKDQFGGETHD
jgi:NAD-dependent DNA ligase